MEPEGQLSSRASRMNLDRRNGGRPYPSCRRTHRGMNNYRCSIISAFFLLLSLWASASAEDVALRLEYYQSQEAEVVDRVQMMRLVKEKQKQKLYDDMIVADESSRRTINALLRIFEQYESDQLRRALPARARVFSEVFIVPAGEASSRAVMVSGKGLYCRFDVRSKNSRTVSAGMSVVYDEQEIYSGTPAAYPMDQFILLHEDIGTGFFSRTLEMLFLKITDSG